MAIYCKHLEISFIFSITSKLWKLEAFSFINLLVNKLTWLCHDILIFLWRYVLSSVQLFVTPWDCRLPGSSVHGIFAGKNTGVGCHFLPHGSSRSRDWTQVSCVSYMGKWIHDYFTTPSLWEHFKGLILSFLMYRYIGRDIPWSHQHNPQTGLFFFCLFAMWHAGS